MKVSVFVKAEGFEPYGRKPCKCLYFVFKNWLCHDSATVIIKLKYHNHKAPA